MRVCLIQLDVSLKAPMPERLAHAAELIERCAGADLVMLPELWAHGAWDFDDWAQTAESLDGPTVAALGAAAKSAGVRLHGGTVLERDGEQLFNTAVLLGPDGSLKGWYRKIHRFGFDSGEAALVSAGEQSVIWPIGEVPAAVATCYDLRFPELFRRQVPEAELVLLAASWPARRAEHWRLLARARAVENQVYVLACGASGTQAGVEQAGYSAVIDPWGEVLAEAGTDEQILDVEFDPARVAEVRAQFPVLRDRRL
ncbi:MAG TPA: nitrilase-related carbon-nitrogen hydrolase [Sporichthyaceae bacterium]|nr:nitrilase-related carbon-nitrogen hydrolase [Sporichthyaceae bacterium]